MWFQRFLSNLLDYDLFYHVFIWFCKSRDDRKIWTSSSSGVDSLLNDLSGNISPLLYHFHINLNPWNSAWNNPESFLPQLMEVFTFYSMGEIQKWLLQRKRYGSILWASFTDSGNRYVWSRTGEFSLIQLHALYCQSSVSPIFSARSCRLLSCCSFEIAPCSIMVSSIFLCWRKSRWFFSSRVRPSQMLSWCAKSIVSPAVRNHRCASHSTTDRIISRRRGKCNSPEQAIMGRAEVVGGRWKELNKLESGYLTVIL